MRKWTQFLGGVIASLGGFVLGMVIGWSSPAQSKVKSEFGIHEDDFKWIASAMAVGAALSQIITAALMDLLGRKWCIITLSAAVSLAGLILIFLKTFIGYLLGRILLGFFAGGTCVVCPTYVGEISHKSIRGVLGTFFQLNIVLGILYSYCFAYVEKIIFLNCTFLFFPVFLGIVMIFLPESPVYLLKKSKEEKARKALTYFRGPNEDIEEEMTEMKLLVKKDETSFWINLKRKDSIKAFLMLLGLNVIQQLCGINAVVFYTHKIFNLSGTNIDDKLSVILVGIVQVLAIAFPIATIDRIGRKILWYISLSIMAVCHVTLGAYFMIYDSNKKLAIKMSVVPTIAVCLYIFGFNCGAGPLPWVMIGEILPTRVKAVLGTCCAFVNWMLAFLVTITFPILIKLLGAGWVFFIYAIICGLGIVFVVFCLMETRNKSLQEIQEILQGKPTTTETVTS